MPPVRVELVEKQRLDNHRPEFRPTDSAKLYGSERTLATAVNRIADAIPTSLVVDYIYGRVQARNLTRRIVDLVQDDPTMIEKPVFAGFQVGEVDEAAQERKDLNRRLRELGANVRLRSTGELRKALDEVVWEPPYLGSFDVTDPYAPSRVHARMQSQRILTDLSRSTVDSIDTIVQNSFRVTQTFSTGRTVAGLTPTQTAASIFTALDEIGPTPTGADLAARTAVHTRGLFPRYALAVERSGNAAGYRAARNGASAARVLEVADRQMRRHGEKLRRSRARMIARTEIAVAQNAGILAQQQALIDQGVASPNSQREWITGPFDVCPICTPLGGTRIGQADFFSWQGGSGFPPAHPNCRCKTRLVPTIDSPPQRIGEGTVLDPYRYEFPDGWVAPVNPVRPPTPRPRPRPRTRPAPARRPRPAPRPRPAEVVRPEPTPPPTLPAARQPQPVMGDYVPLRQGNNFTLAEVDETINRVLAELPKRGSPRFPRQDAAYKDFLADGSNAYGKVISDLLDSRQVKTRIATDEGLDDLIAQGWTEVHRGASGPTEIGRSFVARWMDDAEEVWDGWGVYGNGTYAAKDRLIADAYAMQTSGPGTTSVRFRMAIDPKARTVTQQEAWDQFQSEYQHLRDMPLFRPDEFDDALEFFKNPKGRDAMGNLKGDMPQATQDEIVAAAQRRGIVPETTTRMDEFTPDQVRSFNDYAVTFNTFSDEGGFNEFGMWAYRNGIDVIHVENRDFYVILNPSATATSRNVRIGQDLEKITDVEASPLVDIDDIL